MSILIPILAFQTIVVTASRAPVALEDSPASTTIFEAEALDALSLPALPDLLRLAPGIAVAATGPRGTQTQVRIRGAEANHTLVFVDGIRFNDPAAGNEARFELLTSDSLARLEIVRGPQSALWGSEALGGVIAAATADPFRGGGFEGLAEYGSLDSARLSGRYALRAGNVGVMASANWLRSDGIDSFGGGGDRDGFDNRAASLRIEARPGAGLRVGVTGHWIEGRSDYDGFDPVFFTRADTADTTENRIAAVRGWAAGEWGGWSAEAGASWLDSANRNRLAGAPLNSTFGDRATFAAQLSRRIGGHRLTAAIEHEREGFRARDTAFFGGTDQDRSRRLTAFVGEWRAEWSPAVVTDVALRHDSFSAFADATTLRAALLVRPARGLSLHAAYGEGIAQPTFYDLHGFFPGSFAGNPALRPEHARGWEAGIAWRDARFSLAATWFSARLRDEIVDVFDPLTFLSSTANAAGASRRDGIELSAGFRQGAALNLQASYTWLDADEQRAAGAALVREVRRPRHSFNLIGFGEAGAFRWGASLAYVGRRRDTDFDLFPAAMVTLDDYVLASANLAYRVLPRLELFARAENAFDADYQDVVGYNTAGRTVHAGLRVAFGD
ncbi:MAG TPA: TonB-dependent receptor [Allosphingosinicella sp.]|nr:TonB-dependent receptor [Allosphingosinicella sp.]